MNLQMLPATTDGQTVKLALLNTRSVSNKTHVLQDFFGTHELDVMLLTETWLHAGEVAPYWNFAPSMPASSAPPG